LFSKNKQLFCLSHEKAMHKQVNEIDAKSGRGHFCLFCSERASLLVRQQHSRDDELNGGAECGWVQRHSA
jgi:hypothetical protein